MPSFSLSSCADRDLPLGGDLSSHGSKSHAGNTTTESLAAPALDAGNARDRNCAETSAIARILVPSARTKTHWSAAGQPTRSQRPSGDQVRSEKRPCRRRRRSASPYQHARRSTLRRSVTGQRMRVLVGDRSARRRRQQRAARTHTRDEAHLRVLARRIDAAAANERVGVRRPTTRAASTGRSYAVRRQSTRAALDVLVTTRAPAVDVCDHEAAAGRQAGATAITRRPRRGGRRVPSPPTTRSAARSR